MGTIKDRNGMNLKEAEVIKNRWQDLFTINPEVLLPVLHSWRSLETIGRIKLKFRSCMVFTGLGLNSPAPEFQFYSTKSQDFSNYVALVIKLLG